MGGPSQSSFYRLPKHCQRWLDSTRSTWSEEDCGTWWQYGMPGDDMVGMMFGRRGRRNLPRVQPENGALDMDR